MWVGLGRSFPNQSLIREKNFLSLLAAEQLRICVYVEVFCIRQGNSLKIKFVQKEMRTGSNMAVFVLKKVFKYL